tara:strand:+ start:4245 stop:4841 length:597 start_codon:yes stop_codon:yes gene_type:complete
MTFVKHVVLVAALAALQACSILPPQTFTGHGDPESLLDVSTEVVNLSVHDQTAVDSLSQFVEKDQPSRAELYCPAQAEVCEQTMSMLDVYGVPYESFQSSEYMVALVYERVLTRDCENRFIDNTINPYNMHSPTFGCSMAVNMAQMVTDKKQFVRPDLLGPMDAVKGVQIYRNYLEPPALPEPEGLDGESLVQDIELQ